MRTVDSILKAAEDAVKNAEVWSPSVWVEAAWSLNALVGEEHSKLYELEQRVAQDKVLAIEGGATVARAEAMIEATDLYREKQMQKAKIGRVEEAIRIAKIMARMKGEEMK